MPSLFDKLNKEMTSAGARPRTEAARAWLGQKISKTRIPTNRSNILNDATRVSAKAFIGKMYMFRYDPKYKEVLNVYDVFPLVIPFNVFSDGFIGINLHYVESSARRALLNQLSRYKRTNQKNTYMQISWTIIRSAINSNAFKDSIHRYLSSHIVSSIVKIEDHYWEKVVDLPTQRFIRRN